MMFLDAYNLITYLTCTAFSIDHPEVLGYRLAALTRTLEQIDVLVYILSSDVTLIFDCEAREISK